MKTVYDHYKRCLIFKFISKLRKTLFSNSSHEIKSAPTENPAAPITKKKQTAVPTVENADSSVRVYSRDQHNISRKNIHPNALKVLNRLNKFGYEAYLVGGCVRDLLLDQTPKDFDIATNATPEQVQKAFRNCRLVGRRFRLAHILFGREIIEVATFRGEHDKDEKNRALSSSNESGMLLRDNIYGTIEQDALRRDFTINSLYYDIKDFTIRDYCNGMSDLKKGIIRLIGDPETRYREDPVRMLRAIRFKAKLGMTIEPKTEEPILALVPLLKNIPNPRLFDESLKLLQTGYGSQVYPLLEQYQVLPYLFPSLVEVSRTNQHTKQPTYAQQMITLSLKNTDERIKNDLRVNPAFLFAAMLWYPLIEKTESFINESSLPYHDAFNLAISEMLSEQCRVTSIPKRITTVIVDIWQLQLRLTRLTPKRIESTFAHNKFRAGYDLLVLRSQIENNQLVELATWWEKYQQSGIDNRIELVKNSPAQKKDGPTGKKKRNYRRPRKPKSRPKSE